MVDSHTHILDARLIDESEQIVANMKNNGIEFIVEIGADPQESKDALEFANKHENVYCTIGTHPIRADQYGDFSSWAREVMPNKKIVAMGECGLDFYHKRTTPEQQIPVFIEQIKLADELGLPLVVHSRDACNETYEMLKQHKEYLNNGVLIHCFSYSAEEEEIYKTLDCYFAFGGAITYRKCDVAAAAIINTPIDRIIAETDCPYLSPVPVRDEVNRPRNVRYVIEHMAKILDKTFEEMEKITSENARRFYRIGK